jgi:carbamoylphosphate synthase large subunit/REP element-mobilizing transposase RayT
MPKDTSIRKILVIGSGPIVIGQGCEFDYSGVQACKALKEEGYTVVLINSNPATIMTDPEFAARTYIEPLTPEVVEKIIEREKPDALLPTLGGQTALNLSMTLHHTGVLAKHNVRMIGAKPDAIEKGENRMKFKEAMIKIGLDMPKSGIAHTMEEARRVADDIGTFPLIIRPGFTLGGTGGGIAYNREEFETICARGIDLSPVSEVLIDESLLGWKEYEMEVMRDHADNCVVICSIENLDPMGVHTGDSITVAPIQTLTDREYQIMRDASFAVIREVGVETGGSNIQFATHPDTGRMIVIEMNPRVSRSSALASKATGFPIAKIAAKLAVGYSLDEIRNDITRETPASFEPTIDYVVTKIPRFTFEKFPTADATLTTQMKSVGEAMAIGRTFKESLQKALRSLETGRAGLGADGKDPVNPPKEEIVRKLSIPNAERIFWLGTAFREGYSVEEVFDLTKIDGWFLRQIEELTLAEGQVRNTGVPPVPASGPLDRKVFFQAYTPDLQTDKSRRNLPHWHQEGTTIFVTFRLADALPAPLLATWRDELDAWLARHPEPWDPKTAAEYEGIFNGRRQEYLDQGHGSCALRDPGAAQLVASALQHFDGKRYVLDHFVVMPNHVHVLFCPLPGHNPTDILHSWKSFTAKTVNKLIGATGIFWMEESFDRIVRDWTELLDYRRYVLGNPAKAHLGRGQFLMGEREGVVLGEEQRSRGPLAGTGGTPVFLASDLRRWKRMGFSDRQLAYLSGSEEDYIRSLRKQYGIIPTYRLVDTCAAEFEAYTPYYYSTYGEENETRPSTKRKVMILGGGPNRIGQGIEFDYCCVHAAFALKEMGFETIMVNSNPETVSTDYDTSDRLYFEPLTFEDVMNIYENEQCWGVIVQLGGQTPLNLAAKLEEAGCHIIGTSPKNIELAEDRKFFAKLLDDLKLNQAPSGTAVNEDEAVTIAQRISYPVLVRPSFVLGGRAMQIVYSDDELRHYMRNAVQASPERPVLVDRFLEDAAEVDVDVISDGETTVVGAIMEHIEQAGVHSGDSACVIPAFGLSEPIKAEIMRAAKELAKALNVIGLMNIQFAVKDEILYVIEVNPRASRTVPFVSKSIGRPLAKYAAKIMASDGLKRQGLTDIAAVSLKSLGFTTEIIPTHFNVKEAVFPFSKFPGTDIALGPEMKSTGEVMGIDADHAMAFAKSQMAAGNSLPLKGKVFISVSDRLKPRIGAIAREYHDLGFSLVATDGTRKAIEEASVPCEKVHKIAEGRRPNILDMMKNGEIAMIINTPSEKETRKDEVLIRSTSVSTRTPIQTTLRGARAAAHAIGSLQKNKLEVKTLQEYHGL